VAHAGLRSAEQCCVSGLRNDHLPLSVSHFKATLLLLGMILKGTWPSGLLICEMSASSGPRRKPAVNLIAAQN
jgi:hypothetical protein